MIPLIFINMLKFSCLLLIATAKLIVLNLLNREEIVVCANKRAILLESVLISLQNSAVIAIWRVCIQPLSLLGWLLLIYGVRVVGHAALECVNPRYIDKTMILEKSAEEAWEDLKRANDEDDFDSFKIVFSLLHYTYLNYVTNALDLLALIGVHEGLPRQ